MTSTLKTPFAPDTSAIANGQGADASDVLTPIGDLAEAVDTAEERLSVSATDTHMKHLQDALAAGTGLAWTKTSAGADEKMQIALDSKLVNLLAFLTNLGKLLATGFDTTGAPAGYALQANGSGGATYGPQGPGGGQPIDITVTAAENLAVRDFVYINSSGQAARVDTDSTTALSSLRGVVIEATGITSGATGAVRIVGDVTGFTGLTPGGEVFGSTSAGGYTQTKPAPAGGAGQIAIVRMGVAYSATTITVDGRTAVEYVRRDTVSNGSSMTIVHFADAARYTRRVFARAVNGSGYEEELVCGRWSGGTRDVAARMDNGSGSNATTNTTFQNTSGGTLDLICSVVLQ